MSEEQETNYIPPFAKVSLVECRDRIALAPVPAYREFFAYGKKKAREVTFEKENGEKELFWEDCTEDEEVWAVVQWIRFEDGHQEEGTVKYMRAPATEEDARKAMEDMARFDSEEGGEVGGVSHGQPLRQAVHRTAATAKPGCVSVATLPACPAGSESPRDKSLVVPTAKAVASPVAQ